MVKEIAEVKVAQTKKGEFYQKLSDGDKVELEKFTRWSVEKEWADFWVNKPGVAVYRITPKIFEDKNPDWQMTFAPLGGHTVMNELFSQQTNSEEENYNWVQDVKILKVFDNGLRKEETRQIGYRKYAALPDQERKLIEDLKKNEREQFSLSQLATKENDSGKKTTPLNILYVFPNYRDYGYGIFLLDSKSRDYVLKNIGAEKDDFLRSMMWGALWDSVREAELNPKDYVELAIKNIAVEEDESTINAILSRVGTAMNYYLPSPAGLQISDSKSQANPKSQIQNPRSNDLAARLETVLAERIGNAKTPGQRITFYRAYLSLASSAQAQKNLRDILAGKSKLAVFQLRTKDKFDIVTRLLILGDRDAPQLLAALEKTETSDDAKRYAYAARAGIGSAETKAKYFRDFMTNREISESWIEAALGAFNSARHAELTLQYLETALAELPNLKRNRKIFFVNGWLGAFIGGQKSPEALAIVNKFLADNQNLDRDLRLKILENVDGLERAVKIRGKF